MGGQSQVSKSIILSIAGIDIMISDGNKQKHGQSKTSHRHVICKSFARYTRDVLVNMLTWGGVRIKYWD